MFVLGVLLSVWLFFCGVLVLVMLFDFLILVVFCVLLFEVVLDKEVFCLDWRRVVGRMENGWFFYGFYGFRVGK